MTLLVIASRSAVGSVAENPLMAGDVLSIQQLVGDRSASITCRSSNRLVDNRGDFF